MDDQNREPETVQPEPVPLTQFETRPTPAGSGSRVGRALLLGAWRADGVPTANGMRLTGLVWGLLLAALCLTIYRLQPYDKLWGGLLADTPVGRGLLLLVVMIGFLVGNVTLQARQRRDLSPAVSRTVLLALLIGGLLAQWSWRASSVWVVALILTPLFFAVTAYLAASLVEQGRKAVWVILGTVLGVAMILVGATILMPPQVSGPISMAIYPQGPLAAFTRAFPVGGADLPGLIDNLGNRDWQVARAAANELANRNDPRAIEPLRQAALESTNGQVGMFAAYALGKITDPRARQALAELGNDPKCAWLPEVREVKIAAAGQQLGQALSDIRSADVKTRLDAMAMLELAATKEHLPVILQALKDPDPKVRVSAARTLERLKDPRSLDALIVAARDRDRSVRNVSIWALADLEDPRAIPILVEASQNNKEQDRRDAAWRGLAELPDERSARAMIQWQLHQEGTRPQDSREALVKMKAQARLPLIEAATSNEYRVRRNCISLLRELYPGDIQAKAAIARGEKIFDATALKEQLDERGPGPSTKADLILRGARSDNPAVQAVAREESDDLSGKANEQILMEARKDPDPRVRAMAVWALGNRYFGGREAEKAVQDALEDKSPLVRRAAIERSEHTFGQGVVDIIVQHMNHDPDVQVRLLATKRFEEHVPSRDDQPLIYDTLHDKDPRVRAGAVHVIDRQCRDYRGAYEALQKARQDPDPTAREAVRKAIAKFDQYRRDYGNPQR